MKRPRKRRAPQGKQPDHEVDMTDTPIIKPPTPTLRRRHSTHSNLSTEPYPLFIPPTASPSTHPIVSLPPLPDYSLRLAPLQYSYSGSQQYHSSGHSSSRTLIFDGDKDRDDGMWAGVGRGDGFGRGAGSSRAHSHASTPSTSSSYSAQSRSDASSVSGRRGNPMSISSLLNEPNHSAIVVPPRSTAIVDAASTIKSPPTVSMEAEVEDVDMKDKDTPFSSEQTLRPPSPAPSSSQNPASYSTRSHPASSHDQSSHRPDKSSHSTRERAPSSRRPGNSSRRSPRSSKTPTLSSHATLVSAQKATPQQQQQITPASSTRKKSSGKVWQSVMDLSQMDVESESE